MKKRMIMWEKSLFDALWCAAMILFVCAANVVAQTGIVRQGLPACSASDKVEVASFSRVDSGAGENTRVGQTVKLWLKIRSKCPQGTADLRVPWEIKKITANNSTRIGSGTETLAPGASKEVTMDWTAVAGTHNFYGSVTLTDGGNNNTSDDVVFTVIRYVTQWLEPLKAVGSFFGVSRTTSYSSHSNCSFSMTGLNNAQLGAPDELVMRYSCTSDTDASSTENSCAIFRAFGSGGNFDAFWLQNTWRIKSVTSETRQGSWTKFYDSKAGDISILLAGEGCAKRRGGQFERVVKIQIEGPEGTNPYQ